jgi:hypothetical protein
MQSKGLQLVLPSSLHDTYTEKQKALLMSIDGFLDMVRQRQRAA